MNSQRNKYSLILFLLLSIHATAGLAERADHNKPINMEADRVTIDDTNQTSTFEGNVKLQQGTLLIEAAKVFLIQDKKGYSQVTATGQPAHVRQKRDSLNEYVDGFGERIEYDSYAETANIYGQARIKRNGDDVRGEHVIYNTKTGIFQVFGSNEQAASEQTTDKPEKGRVTIVIQPKSKMQDTGTETQATPEKILPTITQPQ